jgi:hypothetical protein
MPLTTKTNDQLRLFLTACGMATLVVILVIGTMVVAPGFYKHEINWKWTRFGVVTFGFVAYCLKTY